MNNVDKEYFRLLKLVLENGRKKTNRTGINTLGTFGAQARFNLAEGFPLLTTKKVFFKGIVHELIWFLSGSTNIKYLVDNDVHIWDEWAYKRYKDLSQKPSDTAIVSSLDDVSFNQIEFIQTIKKNPIFAQKYGELGEGTYGGMWRDFPFFTEGYFPDDKSFNFKYEAEGCVQLGGVDQIQKVIDKLQTNPDDRRLIVSAWHPYWVDHCALPPCHILFQFHTEELTIEEREAVATDVQKQNAAAYAIDAYDKEGTYIDELTKQGVPTRRLNCQLYQRSCDLFLGVPFNIASYSLLTHMVAHVVNMVPGEFVHTYGDLHIYENHLEQVKLQLSRTPIDKLPKLILNTSVKNLLDFKYNDIQLVGYESHPPIKGEVAV